MSRARALSIFAKAGRKNYENLAPTMGASFIGTIVAASDEVISVAHHAGKSKGLQALNPYVGANSYHRVGVERGQQVLLTVRPSTKKPEATAYYQSSVNPAKTAEEKRKLYDQQKNLYRPLLGGEQSLLSSGNSELFIGSGPQTDIRAGAVRSWWDQDTISHGTRAATHVRELHLQTKEDIADEERFGAVQRPDDALSGASVSSISGGISGGIGMGPTSGNPTAAAKSKVWTKFIDAPVGTTIPNQPVNASAASDPTSIVSSVSSSLLSGLQLSDPAKEYTRVLKTKSGMLVDHREGHVMDLSGQQINGKFQQPLRVQRKIYGSAGGGGSSTVTTLTSQAAVDGSGTATWEEQVDDQGNWYIGLPSTASQGIKFEIPQGKFEVKSGTASASISLDGVQNNLKMISSATAEVAAEQELKVRSQKVKLGQSDAAIHKAILTQVYKANEQGTFTGLLSAQTTEALAHTAAGAGLNVLSSIFMIVSALPVTPGAIVAVMAKAESLIPTIFHTVLPVLKNLKGGFGGLFAGAWDTYESQNVELS